MYFNRVIPENDNIARMLQSDLHEYIEISRIRPGPDEIMIDTVRIPSSEEAEIKKQLHENLELIEQKIMEPTQWIVKTDRFETSLNQRLIDAKINSYRFWQKTVIGLVLGLAFLLLVVLGFMIARPLIKPQPVLSTLPNLQYSAYEGYEDEFVDLLQEQKELFMRYLRVMLIFPRGSLFPIQIISAFQRFTQANRIDLKLKDEILNESIEEKTAYVILEDETLAQLIELAAQKKLTIGDQIGILGYGDSPLKRVIANGITVIDISYEDCKPGGMRQMKAAAKKCLTFVRRNTL
jgi:hypothetical protein